MELRLLQSFLVVADELHFGRAAARLHIAQPPLTKQIHQLEKSLGVQLFERHSRGVRLTPAGQVLVPEAHNILDAVDATAHSVRNAQYGHVGRVLVGYSGAVGMSQMPKLLRSIRDEIPGVDVDIMRHTSASHVADAVTSGDLDLGLILDPGEHRDLSVRTISIHRPVLVVARDHPMAPRDQVHVAELADEELITPRRFSGSVLLELIHRVCAVADFSPRVVKEADDAPAVLTLVASGLGASITTTGVDQLPEELRYIPLVGDTELPYLESALAWRTKNSSELLERVIRSVVPPLNEDGNGEIPLD